MADRRTAPRLLLSVAVVTMVLTAIGFVLTLVLNAFVLDKYDAYGEVPIPGKASLQLPAGEATITFHATAIGYPSGAMPIPDLQMSLQGPDGGHDPQVTESIGTTTTVNNDMRRRVWVAQVPQQGTYDVITDGNVSAFLNPTLAFGRGSDYGSLPWILAAVFGVAVLDMIVALVWLARTKRRPSVGLAPNPFGGSVRVGDPPPAASTRRESVVPSDSGVRIEQLKTLAALRDSGALTEQEFEAEKRRVLGES